MFVAIENNEMNVPQVLDWINRTKNANNNVISPEFAMEILGKTNFYGHIKTVLKNIKDRCKTKEDVEPYKEFILSCVDRREVSPQAMEDLVAMAKLCGCEKEFDEADGKTKIYEVKDCENADVKIVKSIEEFEALEGNDLRIFFDADEVDLSYYNLKGLKIKFKEGADVYLSYAAILPKDLDVSMCSTVGLSGCDLEGIRLKFREGAEVILHSAMNLPKDLDVSMCSKVNLGYCNIWGFDLKFREGAEVDLSCAENLPKELDVSMCSKVDLSRCDLSRVEKIRFKDKKQEEEFMDGALNFNGEVEYVGDKKSIDLVNGNGGLEI